MLAPPSATCMSVMFSPFNRILPSALRVFFLACTSSALSSTRFMYSSNPIICPSMLRSLLLNNQILIFDLF